MTNDRTGFFGGHVDAPSTLREIHAEILKWYEKKFGDTLGPNPMEYMALKICEEAGEVASAVIGMNGKATATGSGNVLDECVDVLITTLVLMGEIYPGIDVETEIQSKLAILNNPASGHRASVG